MEGSAMKEFAHEYAEILYHTPTELEKLGGLWPVRTGHNEAKPNYRVGPKVIECYSLHFVADGQLLFHYAGETVCLSQGDIFCLYPQNRYSYELKPGQVSPRLRMYWLAFDGGQAESLLARAGLDRRRPYLPGGFADGLEQVVEELQQLLRHREEYREPDLQALLFRLFGQLWRSSAVHSGSGEEGKHWLDHSIAFLHMHYMEGISVADVVKVAGVRKTGLSPGQYLNKLRMEKGAGMLMAQDMSVTDISYSLGYPDLFSFSRAFCRHFGVSPTHYRKRLIIENTAF
jgi:AraC-like DNA-binding protein